MKNIVFHSYKGGSGRTLALANIAYMLQMTGRKVLLIDMDFDAPGLAYKMGVSKRINNGYIAYLDVTSPESRANQAGRENRIKRLRNYIVDIEPDYLGAGLAGRSPIKLLSCGNPETEEYWIQLGSNNIQETFSFGLAATRGSTTDLGESQYWEAFQQDILDIKKAAENPEYCLIDCRSIRDTVSPALWGWADHVVEFFHCNLEGILGLHLLLDRLSKSGDRLQSSQFTPAVTRTPHFMHINEIRARIDSLWQDLRSAPSKREWAFDESFLENLVVLREQQAVEAGDLSVMLASERSEYSLAHEYVALMARVVGDSEQNVRTQLRASIGLDRDGEIADRMFGHYKAEGSLLNRDREENVALRKKTLTILVDSVLAGLYDLEVTAGVDPTAERAHDPRIRSVFREAGLEVGDSFGRETSDNANMWRDRVRPHEVDERLAQWCEFDGQAGLGMWTAEWNTDLKLATLRLKNHFLDEVKRDLGLPFLLGYLEGVLEHVLADTGTVKVEFVEEPGTAEPRVFRFKISEAQ